VPPGAAKPRIGQDKKTPAMRLGLADGPVDLAKIIGHRWSV
jgi:hypothetical protein